MTSKTLKVSLVALISLLCLLTSGGLQQAFAQDVGIRVSPSVIEIIPNDEASIKQKITVSNTTENPVEVDVVFKLFRADKNGSLVYPHEDSLSEESKSFIRQGVRLLDDSEAVTFVTLAPKQKKELTLEINTSAYQNISQYSFSLLFITRSAKSGSGTSSSASDEPISEAISQIAIGTGTHVLFVEETIPVSFLKFTKFTMEKTAEGVIVFNTVVNNPTEYNIKIYGNISITNFFRQRIGVVTIPEQIILGKSARLLRRSLNDEGSSSLTWKPGLMLGSYKAQLTLYDTSSDDILSKNASLSSYPVKPSIIFLFLVIGLIIVIQQIRKQL